MERNQSFLSDGKTRCLYARVRSASLLILAPASTEKGIMNFHPPSFNLMLSEGDSYAHAASANLRYSSATNAGSDANLFHFPVTLRSLEDLSSDSEVEIFEAIGMQILNAFALSRSLLVGQLLCVLLASFNKGSLNGLECTFWYSSFSSAAIQSPQKFLFCPRSEEAARTSMRGSLESWRRSSNEHSIQTCSPERRSL